MLWLKLLQQLVKTLNSEGAPGQVAAGIALGAALGLTPLLNLHNLAVLALVCLLNVSFPAAMLGWAVFTPLGFALDPAFDWIGHQLLIEATALRGMWTAWYNTPVVPLTNFNNSVVLGSFVSWLVLFPLVFVVARFAVRKYRETIYQRLKQTKVFQVIAASKLYNLYRLFRTD